MGSCIPRRSQVFTRKSSVFRPNLYQDGLGQLGPARDGAVLKSCRTDYWEAWSRSRGCRRLHGTSLEQPTGFPPRSRAACPRPYPSRLLPRQKPRGWRPTLRSSRALAQSETHTRLPARLPRHNVHPPIPLSRGTPHSRCVNHLFCHGGATTGLDSQQKGVCSYQFGSIESREAEGRA